MTIPKVDRIIETINVEESDIDTENEPELFDIKTYINEDSEQTEYSEPETIRKVKGIKKWKNTQQHTEHHGQC